MFRLIIPTLFIFALWYLVGHLSGSSDYLSVWGFILPATWSALFAFLLKRGYGYNASIGYAFYLLMFFADELCFREAVIPRYGDGFLSFQSSYLFVSVIFTLGLNFSTTLAQRINLRYVLVVCSSLTILATMIPLSYITYSLGLNAEMTRDVIFAIMATNQEESLKFALIYLSPILIVFYCAIFAGTIALLSLQLFKRRKTKALHPKQLIISIIILLALLSVQPRNFRLYGFIFSSIQLNYSQTGHFFETQLKFATEDGLFVSTKEAKGETYVVIIGESHNPAHMGIYGYERDTTPQLDKLHQQDNLLVFKNAFASHTHTVESLCLGLTEANLQNKYNYFESPSIIHIFNRAGFDTTWLSNQWLRDDFSNAISTIVMHSGELMLLSNDKANGTDKRGHDGVVLEPAEKKLKEDIGKNRIIFVHLRGSHWDYADRYPAEFARFTEIQKAEGFELWNQLSDDVRLKLNHYDNSVLFNDSIIASLIDMLDEIGGVSGLVYFSDHGEDVYGDLGHNSSQATLPMTQIPLVMWFSPDYIKKYQNKFNTLSRHTDQLFCNDSIYDTLIGISDIKTDRVEGHYDLSSESYKLDLEDTYTLYGRVKYEEMLNQAPIPELRAPSE